MGTRNLTYVVKNGEYKIAQYGQWDGNPSGQGQTIVEFLLNEGNIRKLESILSKVRYLDRKGKDKDFIELFHKNAPEWLSDSDNRTPEQIRWFSTYMTRNLGAEILSNIANSKDSEIVIDNQIDFSKDSLFCEWAYIINLDTEELEIFKGFNTSPLDKSERFYSEEIPEEYYPVKHYKSIKFFDLTIYSMNEVESGMGE